MEMKKDEAQLLGQLLGLLILVGILLIKIVIIYLDKKWHEKGRGHWMEGIQDLPPLQASHSTQHPWLRQRNQARGMLCSLQIPISTSIDQMYKLNSSDCIENSNWVLTKRHDATQSQ